MISKFASVTLSVLSVLFLAAVTPAPTPAQETSAQPQVLRNPEVNYPVHSDSSPPLRQMATAVSPQQGPHLAPEVKHPKLQLVTNPAQRGLGPLADGALQTSSGPLVSTTPGLNLLGVGNGFPNYTVPDAPSDVNLAVGDTQVVQWVNVSYAVFNKTTGAIIAGPIAGNQFWAHFGGPCESNNSGDIIAQWDKIAHRWVMVQNVFSAPYYTCVAVSQTADATGPYYRFQFNQPYGFPDYPKWGIWPDAYYQSENNFGPTGSSYVGAIACAYERAKMLVGDSTAKQICFTTGTFDDSLLPGDLDSAGTLPPTGQAEVYLGSIDNTVPSGNVVHEYLFHVDFTTPSNSTFTGAGGTMPIGVASFNLACGSGGICIPQNGVTDLLDTLGDRLMYRLAYRNFSDHQTWLVSHSVNAGSSVGERWYEFRAPETSTNLSVFQQGTFAPDSNYRWMGSIAMDGAQDIALGYSISSSSMFPSISYTGRVPSDALGTMENETQIVAGTGSQIGTANRWGDYTSMAIDAADDCTFWYTNQYYRVTASFDWSTRLASFKFPGCGQSRRPTTTTLAANPASSTFGTSVTFTATVAPASGTGTLTGTVTFSDGGTNLGTGTLTPSRTATFTTSTLSAGSHSITATYGGDPTFGGSASTPLAYAVAKAKTTTTVSSNSSSVYGQSVTFTATVSPSAATGTVQFFDGTTSLGTATLSGGNASVSTSNLAVGSHSITATYNGNSNYNTSASGSVTFTVSQATSTTSLASSLNPSMLGQSVTFTATVSPSAATGTVTFKDGATALGTVALSGGKASVSTSNLAVGSHSITATYSGDANATGSTSLTLTQTVNPAPAGNFSLSATPSTRTVNQGSRTTYMATVSAVNGFAGSVSFSASGLPAGATASFSPNSVTTSGTSTMTVTTASTTPTGSFTITVTGTSGTIVHIATVALVVSSSDD